MVNDSSIEITAMVVVVVVEKKMVVYCWNFHECSQKIVFALVPWKAMMKMAKCSESLLLLTIQETPIMIVDVV